MLEYPRWAKSQDCCDEIISLYTTIEHSMDIIWKKNGTYNSHMTYQYHIWVLKAKETTISKGICTLKSTAASLTAAKT